MKAECEPSTDSKNVCATKKKERIGSNDDWKLYVLAGVLLLCFIIGLLQNYTTEDFDK